MLDYAAQDVSYLPLLYQAFDYIISNHNQEFITSTSMSEIFTESLKWNDYATINTEIKELSKGMIIKAFVK